MQPTESSVGKTIRMNRIFREDGRALMVAINHGLALGATKGIERMPLLLPEIMKGNPDAFTIHKGTAMRNMDVFAGRAALVMKSTNATRFFHPEETPISTVEEALRLGADAIAIGLTLADPLEKQAITHAAAVVAEAERYGLPTVTHSYPCGNLLSDAERFSLENVAYATRVSLEMGIDIIKTYWTGSQDTFAKVVEYGAPAKVIISGGPRCDTLEECFAMTWQGTQAGAAGIAYGRNIWQHPYPAAVTKGLWAILHANATVKEAMQIAEDAAGTKLQ